MPSLRIKFNYRQDTAIPAYTHVHVLRRNGTTAVKVFLGFVDVYIARQMLNARPCRIEAYAYGTDDYWLEGVVYLKDGEYIQGALTSFGVHAVTVKGVPRVVPGPKGDLK